MYCSKCKRKLRTTHDGKTVCVTKGCSLYSKPPGVSATYDYGGYDG